MNIPSLTGLRGIAALLVFLSHAAIEGMAPRVFSWGLGQIGVMLFFVLSAFLMTHLYFDKDIQNSLKSFVVARIARIFPLYYGLVFVSIILSFYVYPDFHYNFNRVSEETVIKTLTMYSAPFLFWTIPIEVQFYGVFAILWILKKKAGKGPVIIILLVYLLVLFLNLSEIGDKKTLFSCGHMFVLGIFISLFSDRFICKKSTWIDHLVLSLLILLLFVNTPMLRKQYGLFFVDSFMFRTWYDPINIIVISSSLLYSIKCANHFLLSSKPFLHLGNISYSFYLLHYPFIDLANRSSVPDDVKIVLALLMTIAASTLSYYILERKLNYIVKKAFRYQLH